MTRPLVVGIGGTVRPNSTSEAALRAALRGAQRAGARTECFAAAELDLPFYDPKLPDRSEGAQRLIASLRAADGIIVCSPGYHGALSGLVKNALDYVEDLRADPRPYLDGRAVGCVAMALGWQATVTTLTALRSIVHALRGWPTPLGVCIKTTAPAHEADEQLAILGEQVLTAHDHVKSHQCYLRSDPLEVMGGHFGSE